MTNERINLFLKKREEEVNWLYENGFDNGDPNTNGEFNVINSLLSGCDLFIDIGANCGDFTEHVLNNFLETSVMAFEPNPVLFKKLKAIIESRGKAYDVGLSDKVSESDFFIHPDDSTSSSFETRIDMMPHFHNKMNSIKVKTSPLNHFKSEIKEQIKNKGLFIKIDVEGFEVNVLRGSKEVLSLTNSTAIMFEYSTGSWDLSGRKLKEAFHLLDGLDYSMFRVTPLGLEKLKFYDPSYENGHYCNYVALRNGGDFLNNLNKPVPIQTSNGSSSFYTYKY